MLADDSPLTHRMNVTINVFLVTAHTRENAATSLEALGLSPLVQARWADASRIERVPLMAAATSPLVTLAGRPAEERASDAWAGGVEALLFLNFAI